MKKLAMGWISYFILCALATPVYGAIKVTSSADKTKLFLNESFVFTIKIQVEGKIPDDIQIPDISYLNDFHLLGQWSGQESSFQISGGKTQTTQILLKNWRFQPKTVGKLRIEPLTIIVSGKKFQTSPVFITVNERVGKNLPPLPPPLPDPFDLPQFLPDIFNPLKQNTHKPKQEQVKFQSYLEKKTFYINQSLPVSWILFSSTESLKHETEKYPKLKGFLKEETEHRSIFIGTQVIDKVLYRKISINKLFLFPLQIGELEIDPYMIRVRFPLKNYVSNFFGPWKLYTSNRRTIMIKELPVEGHETSSWTGAVGSFKIKAEVSKQSAQTNEPIHYKITFSGTGHPRFIQLPDLKFPSSVRLWPPSEKSKFSSSGTGFKEFSFLMAPLKEGQLEIPSFRLSFFDPELKRYVFHQTKVFSIPVKKGSAFFENNENYFKKETTDKKANSPALDLRPLNWSLKPSFLHYKNLIVLEITVLLFFISLWAFIYIKKLVFNKKTNLKKDLLKELKTVEKLLNKNQFKKANLRLLSINYTLLYSLQEKRTSFLNWRQALAKLPPGLQKKHVKEFKNLFHTLELLSFAPHSEKKPHNTKAEGQNLLQQTENLISQIFSNKKEK